MSTFAQIKARIASDLNDAGVSFSDTDLTYSLQDAYDDIAFLTKCITKKAAGISWVPDLSYVAPGDSISDYMSPIAIFNNVNSRFLDDNVTLRQLEGCGDDWELHHGTPELWTPAGEKRIALYRKYAIAAGTYDFYYKALAPVVVDVDTPLVATDMQKLFDFYCLGDLLEPYGEFATAEDYWRQYFTQIEIYKERINNISKADLLLLI